MYLKKYIYISLLYMNRIFYSRYKGDLINIFFIFLLTYILYSFFSYKISLKHKWKEVKCEPLSIITNNVLNIENNFDPINECFINNKYKDSFIKDNENDFYNYVNKITLLIQEIRGENEKANKELNKYYNDTISKINYDFKELNNNKTKMNQDIETNKNNINNALINLNDKI